MGVPHFFSRSRAFSRRKSFQIPLLARIDLVGAFHLYSLIPLLVEGPPARDFLFEFWPSPGKPSLVDFDSFPLGDGNALWESFTTGFCEKPPLRFSLFPSLKKTLRVSCLQVLGIARAPPLLAIFNLSQNLSSSSDNPGQAPTPIFWRFPYPFRFPSFLTLMIFFFFGLIFYPSKLVLSRSRTEPSG